MRQVSRSIRDGRIRVLDVPPPALRPHGVLARTAFSLVTVGTEGTTVETGQKSPAGKLSGNPTRSSPLVETVRRDGLLSTYRTIKARREEEGPVGHSCSGMVTAVGELAGGFTAGDRVALAGAEYANHAEVVYVPGTLAVAVPDAVGLDEAAFAAVGAVALQGVRQSGAVLGDRVAVIGLGLVGQLTVQLLRAAGCEVAGMDLDPTRCELAARFGAFKVSAAKPDSAARTLLAATPHGYDAVIIAAGIFDSGPVKLSGRIARNRGTVVIGGDASVQIPRALFYDKELTLRLSRAYGPGHHDPFYEELALDYPAGYVRWTEHRNLAEFMRLLAERRVDVSSLITHRFPFEQASEAYALVSKREERALGVLLEFPQAPRAVREPQRIVLRHASSTVQAPEAHGRVGVSFLGAGEFATATLLPALADDRRFGRRGVYTVSGLGARDVAKRYHFGYCAGSPDEIFADPGTHAVVIATRHAAHATLAHNALRAGKTVFVEKPLAITEGELAAVTKAQRETGGRATVGFNRRFSLLTQMMTEELAHRSSPAAVLIRVNAGPISSTHWMQRLEEGGGRIVGELCHFVDLAACLVNDQAATVFAVSADSDKPPALSDTLAVTLSYVDGSVATILYAAVGDTTFPAERVEVFCEGAVMVIDDFRSVTITENARTRSRSLSRSDAGHAAEMQAFLDLAQGKDVPQLSFADCAASTAATFKVVESLVTGKAVRVPRVVAEV